MQVVFVLPFGRDACLLIVEVLGEGDIVVYKNPPVNDRHKDQLSHFLVTPKIFMCSIQWHCSFLGVWRTSLFYISTRTCIPVLSRRKHGKKLHCWSNYLQRALPF
ncbi:hypothetical protein BRADI_3g31115v3 [Brachypodium distachyon]|uniref:Uncharacterized protein n=1 Tax=Brachypodium distachyon TaxID=15368 RepID=A0A0Q3JGX9_BRADI|nr:hypothetical protein BRADI_3g31115v3 [Brachypodium distachyon]